MSEQLDILAWKPPASDRFGETFSGTFDFDRLNHQARLVFDVMAPGMWWTLRELADRTGQPEASISARIRDFKNLHKLATDKRRRGEGRGTWEYRLDPSSIPVNP